MGIQNREIHLADLRNIINSIFDHMDKDLGIKSVPLDHDMYWSVLSDQRFEMETIPARLGVGQLFDDWDFLQSILSDKSNAVSLMLIHVAPLLEFIGEKIGQ